MQKISYDEYNKLSEEELKRIPFSSLYENISKIFNLDQTNFAEKYPNRWDILKAKIFRRGTATRRERNVCKSNT